MANNVPYAYESLEADAYNAGYDMQVDRDLNISFTPRDQEYPAQITCKTIIDDGVYYYNPTISFPTLEQQDNWFHDSIPYYVDQFAKAADLCDQIVLFFYNPSEWEEDEDVEY